MVQIPEFGQKFFNGFHYCAFMLLWCFSSRIAQFVKNLNLIGFLSLQTVAGEKMEGQGGRRTRTSSVSSTSSRFKSVVFFSGNCHIQGWGCTARSQRIPSAEVKGSSPQQGFLSIYKRRRVMDLFFSEPSLCLV